MKLAQHLISACYEEDEECRRKKGRGIRTGVVHPSGGGESWHTSKTSHWEGETFVHRPSSSWGRFRAGETPDYYNTERCGSPQSRLNACVKPIMGRDKTKFFLDNLAVSTRTGYWSAWNQWNEFAEQRGRSPWIQYRNDDDEWGGNFLEFLLFHSEVMKRKSSTSGTKVAAVRYFHLINGKGDFTAMGLRVKTLVNGVSKREVPNAKRPYNIELIQEIKKKIDESGNPNQQGDAMIFAAVVMGFFFLLRVSEIANIRRSDITIEDNDNGRRLILVIRRSKTDQAGMGVARVLRETDLEICPVRTMVEFLKGNKNEKDAPIFGSDVRPRMEVMMKTIAAAKGVDPDLIGSHSLRAGGATSLYIRGVSVTLIQRFDRWKSASFIRYLRYDAIALEPLSLELAKSAGMLEQLKLGRP